jgi:hypothetical protein
MVLTRALQKDLLAKASIVNEVMGPGPIRDCCFFSLLLHRFKESVK